MAFKLSRLSATKATLISLFCTSSELFDIPVYWPILLVYFCTLFAITMKRQIKFVIQAPLFLHLLIVSLSLLLTQIIVLMFMIQRMAMSIYYNHPVSPNLFSTEFQSALVLQYSITSTLLLICV